MNIKKYTFMKINSIVLQIVLILIVALYLNSYGFYNLDVEKKVYLTAQIGTISFIIGLILWYFNTKEIFNPYIIFFTSFFMFQFGQSFLISIGSKLKYTHVFGSFSLQSILDAQIFTLFCIMIFNLGALLSTVVPLKFTSLGNYSEKKRAYYMNKLGKLLLLISSPIAIYFSVDTLINSIKYGYSEAVYEMTVGRSVLLTNIESFFIPALFLCVISNLDNKKKIKKLILMAYVYAGINLLIGGRSLAIGLIFALIWLQNSKIKKLNFKKMIYVAIIGFFIVTIASTVADFRIIENKSISSFSKTFMKELEDNPVKEIIEEMGGSMNPLIQVQNIVPNMIPYKNGQSYIYAATSIIPNVGRVLGEVHPAAKYAALDGWLVDFSDLNYGYGFSLSAEAYYNFGKYGVIAIGIIGYLYGKLLYCSDMNRKNKVYTLFINITVLVMTFTVPRRQSLEIFLQIFRYVLIPVIIIEILSRMKKRI